MNLTMSEQIQVELLSKKDKEKFELFYSLAQYILNAKFRKEYPNPLIESYLTKIK